MAKITCLGAVIQSARCGSGIFNDQQMMPSRDFQDLVHGGRLSEEMYGDDSTGPWTNPVSYTHLDVYKRQALALNSVAVICLVIWSV